MVGKPAEPTVAPGGSVAAGGLRRAAEPDAAARGRGACASESRSARPASA